MVSAASGECPWSMLKDLGVFTILRAVFQLAEEIPCDSASVVSLLSDDTVNTIVADMLLWAQSCCSIQCSCRYKEPDLKPLRKLSDYSKSQDLKYMEIIGKTDPYEILHYTRLLFKVKTRGCSLLIIEVLDKDIIQDKKLGTTRLQPIDLEAEAETQSISLSIRKIIFHSNNTFMRHGVTIPWRSNFADTLEMSKLVFNSDIIIILLITQKENLA
ncbi:hypothetical protein SAY86_021602 [Trapa natans]|uniref:Uncharacterized protein n=1 Tax=Trapa natans TaxID=22666 RepID=A0AAN7MSQ8_TRANT|nr:hypothetical protein SAY86_021602 [Trapa natans]